MSDAELVIRLLGDATPEEQAAIAQPMQPSVDPRDNRPSDNREPENRDGSSRPTGTALIPHVPKRDVEPALTLPDDDRQSLSIAQAIDNIRLAFREMAHRENFNSFDVSVSKFGQYVESLIGTRSGTGSGEEARKPEEKDSEASPKKNSWASYFENRSPLFRKVMKNFRRGRDIGTKFGRAAFAWSKTKGTTRVGKAARRVAARVFGSAGTKVAGRVVATAATTAASGATQAAAGGATTAATVAGAGAVAAFGITVGAATAGLTALVIGVGLATKAFNDAADEIEKYSADVALARARGRINTELNMFERAQRIGAASGRLETAKASFGNQTEKLLTDLLAIISKYEPLLSAGVNLAESLVISTRTILAVTERGVAAVEVQQAKSTEDKEDDAKAEKRLADADKRIGDLAKQLATKLAEAFSNAAGKNNDEERAIDPFLRGVLDAEFDDQGNIVRK